MSSSHIAALLIAFASVIGAFAVLFNTPDAPKEHRAAWLTIVMLLVTDALVIGALL